MPIMTIMEVVEAVSEHGKCSIIQITEYTGYGTTTVNKAMKNALSLGLVSAETGDRGTSIYVSTIRNLRTAHRKKEVFQKYLQHLDAFMLTCRMLDQGNDVNEALRKAASLLGIDSSNVYKLTAFIRWAKELGILQAMEDGRVVICDDCKPREELVVGLTPVDLENDIKARLALATQVGNEAFAFMDNTSKDLAVEAMRTAVTDPEGSCETSGKVLEDFLRDIATDKHVNTKKATGAVQVMNCLLAKNIGHTKHGQLVACISTIRAMSAHSKDKETNDIWEKTLETAFVVLQLTLRVIRSLHQFIYSNRQTI